jgi:Flp pilus assembly pilin Flp
MKVRSKQNQRGMAATEYIIGLILVAVGAVSMFTVFGAQIKNKIGQVTAAIGGDKDSYDAAAKATTGITKEASDRRNVANGMKGEGVEVEEVKTDTTK